MLSMDIRHPDSKEFIESKQDLTKVTGANISIRITDDFMEAVEKDEDYYLRFPVDIPDWESSEIIEYNKLYHQTLSKPGNSGIFDIYIKKIKARELWNTFVHCAWNTAEPGVLFLDRHHNSSPDGVYPDFKGVTTNPCGKHFCPK